MTAKLRVVTLNIHKGLSQFNRRLVIHELRDGLDALDPDLVFLDIQLPGTSGIDVVRERGVDRMPLVVFVTAYDEFAVQAFELAAIDYLMKPVTQARFDVTMQRVRRARQRDTPGPSGVGAGIGLHALVDMYDAQAGIPHPGTMVVDQQGVIRAKLFLERYQDRHGTEALVKAAKEIK